LNEPSRADVQIWTVGTGGGHRSVALALAQALRASARGQVTVALDDPTEIAIGRTARRLFGAYGPLIRTSPAAWGMLFRGFSRPQAVAALDRFLIRQLAPAMTKRTRLRSPGVVVNCHPLLGNPVRAATAPVEGAHSKLVTMMTDLVGGHSGWLSTEPDAIFTATPQASKWCREHGVPDSLIRETGLPVDERLALGPAGPAERSELRRRLGLDPDRFCLLLGGGAEGVGHLRQLASWVGSSGLPLQLVVICGNNVRLLGWVRRHPTPVPTLALEFEPSLTPWLRAADAYLGKPGPSTLAEAAAAGLALLVTQGLPGQEEHNDEAVVSAGAAVQVRHRDALLGTLSRLCRPGDPLLGTLQRGAVAWSRPAAAALAAEEILRLLSEDVPGGPPRARTAAA
jgi:UDP-N-acetylglucosamine:LPS N-acetylglucosamine transferase